MKKQTPQHIVEDSAVKVNCLQIKINDLKQKVEDAYDSITLTTSYEEAGKDADLVIEAIAEDPEQKIAFYQELAKHLPEKQ